MKPMRIDFAAMTWRRALYRLHPALLAAGIAGAVLCAGGIWQAMQMAEQRAVREQQLERLRARQAALSKAPAPVAEVAIPEAQANAVNAAGGSSLTATSGITMCSSGRGGWCW